VAEQARARGSRCIHRRSVLPSRRVSSSMSIRRIASRWPAGGIPDHLAAREPRAS
jgi:hypothetical protein